MYVFEFVAELRTGVGAIASAISCCVLQVPRHLGMAVTSFGIDFCALQWQPSSMSYASSLFELMVNVAEDCGSPSSLLSSTST